MWNLEIVTRPASASLTRSWTTIRQAGRTDLQVNDRPGDGAVQRRRGDPPNASYKLRLDSHDFHDLLHNRV